MMRLNRFFYLLSLTSLLFGYSSCNDQEEAFYMTDSEENIQNCFIGIRLHLNGERTTRGTENGFTEGADVEKAIKQLVLTFYDSDGKYLSSNTLQAEDISSDLMVVSTNTSQQPAKVLAWANLDNAANLLKGLSLNDAISKTSTDGYCNSVGDFVMTSATYLDNNSITYGSAIKQTSSVYIKDQVVDATAVDIYLERLAAKVQINKDAQIKTVLPSLNNEGVTFTVKGIALNGTNKSTYLIKNIDNYGFTSGQWQTAWNDATKHRCYWSTDPNYMEKGSNLDAYQYRTFNEIVQNDAQTEYCVENTSGNQEFNIQNTTHVLIVGEYKLKGVKRGTNLYQYNGNLMTAKHYRSLVQQKHPFYTKRGGTYVAIDDSYYGIVRNGQIGNRSANVKIQLKLEAVTQIYKQENGSYVALSVSDANAELAKERDGIKYGKGKCYYAAPIQHLGKEGQIGQYGIVRNHLYQITIESISSFGEGIWNPGDEMAEDNPENPGGGNNPENPGGGNDPDKPGGDNTPEDPNIDPDEPNDNTDEPNPGEIIVPEKAEPVLQYYVGLNIKIINWNTFSQEVDL